MWNSHFPGRTCIAHSGLPDEENEQAIEAMLERKADVLVATTLIECGVNIPGLTHAIIVDAQRFGLVTLHQLRGRLVRHGGVGLFDMFLPTEVKDDTLKRLEVLTKTHDGFKVAEYDMQLRGFGNLSASSEKQTGADDTFLFGRPVNPAIIETMLGVIKRYQLESGGNA